MRKVIVGAFLSLDGVMQAPGGPDEDPTGDFQLGGWVAPHIEEVFARRVDEMMAEPFDLLIGRKTYEIFAAHWPYQSDDDAIAKLFNTVTKYVATRSDTQPLTWKGSVALRGDVAAEVTRLKRQDGPNLLTQGSTELVQTLLEHDLVDEFRLFVFPVVLGRGKRLFGAGAKPARMQLADSEVSGAGVVISIYRRAGDAPTGDFAMDPPTEAELARRERMKREG